MSTQHELKTDSEIFQPVADGKMTFQLRRYDRNFQVGDGLLLKETKHTGAEMKSGSPLEYTGKEVNVDVTFLLKGPAYGLADGWVILAFAPVAAAVPGPVEQPTTKSVEEPAPVSEEKVPTVESAPKAEASVEKPVKETKAKKH